MKQWNKINWPALERRGREIEADLQLWLAERDALKESGATAPNTQLDCAIQFALMVWSDDGGPPA
jgi:hypothetical protein